MPYYSCPYRNTCKEYSKECTKSKECKKGAENGNTEKN